MRLSDNPRYLNLPDEDVDQYSPYDDRADLRDYIEILVRHRWAVAGLALFGALVAWSISLTKSEVYRAETVILPVEQTEYLDFDGRRVGPKRSFLQEVLQSPSTRRLVLKSQLKYVDFGESVEGNLLSIL